MSAHEKCEEHQFAVTACCILPNICLEMDQQTDLMEDDPYPPEHHIHNNASRYRDTICGQCHHFVYNFLLHKTFILCFHKLNDEIVQNDFQSK